MIENLILNKKGTLIDVREKKELIQEGFIQSAIHIPLSQIESKFEEIKLMNKPLILFCRSGKRSHNAINILKKLGITDIYNGNSFKFISEILKKKNKV